MRLLFEGGFYSRAAFIGNFTVHYFFILNFCVPHTCFNNCQVPRCGMAIDSLGYHTPLLRLAPSIFILPLIGLSDQ